MSLTEQIRELNTELGLFEWRRRTLPADLVLMGLATDVLETGAAIQETAESAAPHKAFANARLAFEAAQQMLVLATHDNYEGAGTDAWVYFELKAAAWQAAAVRLRDTATPVSTRQLLKAQVEQMREVWSLFREDAGAMLDRSVESVWDWHDRKQLPDNWLRQNMTQRHSRAYELFAADTGGWIPVDTAATNDAMYKILCHETHANPRLALFEVHVEGHDARVIRKLREAEPARRSVMGATELALMEAVNALRWQRTLHVRGPHGGQQ